MIHRMTFAGLARATTELTLDPAVAGCSDRQNLHESAHR